MENRSLHVIISGRVQGVFFRASTREQALRLRLKGWVRNLPDGQVEALFEGNEPALRKMLEWCHQGPPGSRPIHIVPRWGEDQGKFSDFRIRYTNLRG